MLDGYNYFLSVQFASGPRPQCRRPPTPPCNDGALVWGFVLFIMSMTTTPQ